MVPAQWLLLMASAVLMVVGVVSLFGVEGAAALAAEVLVR
jgi:NADH-quinone oxidoreductase subunit N